MDKADRVSPRGLTRRVEQPLLAFGLVAPEPFMGRLSADNNLHGPQT
jgi:hypothetical protein